MSIYIPYFYIIQNKKTGIYYAGSKYGKNANPSNFMIEDGYTTSSNIINSIINEHGLNIFIVRRIKIFTNKVDAYNYETRFLKKVNSKQNALFYNMHNNDHIFTFHDSRYKKKMLEVYGVEDPNSSEIIRQRIEKSNMLKLGVPYPMMSKVCKEKSKLACIKRYGVENAMQSEEIKNKQKQNNIKKYRVENVFQTQHVKDKIKTKLNERYGVDYPMQSEEIKDKQKQSIIKKYGVENSFQSDIAKTKIKLRMDYLLNRPELDILRKYQKKYRLKFGQGWVRKSDDYIQLLLNETINTYGEF